MKRPGHRLASTSTRAETTPILAASAVLVRKKIILTASIALIAAFAPASLFGNEGVPAPSPPSADAPQVREWLRALAADASDRLTAEASLRRHAADCLPVIWTMLSAGTDEEARRATIGLAALRQLAAPLAEPLVSMLNAPGSGRQTRAVRALGAIGAAAGPASQKLVESSRRRWLRLPALEALAEIGAVDTIPHFIEALSDENTAVALAAAQGLARFGSAAAPAAPALAKLLKESDARLLGDRLRLATPKDYQLRLSAARALGAIGPDAAPALPVMIKLLRRAPTGAIVDLDLKRALVHALGDMGPAAAPAKPALEMIYNAPNYYPKQLSRPILESLQRIESPGLL